MKHEIIIKNGVAGVEINGRFYTHTDKHGDYARLLDITCANSEFIWYAYCDHDYETVSNAERATLTPIPNHALDWPAGTRVMVRNSDLDMDWEGGWSVDCFNGRSKMFFCVKDEGGYGWWPECKLAEGGE